MKIEPEDFDESVVALDTYNSDLNLVIDASNYSAHPLTSEGFAFMWSGARCTHGVAKGKICFEVKILDNADVSHLPADEPNPHVVRVGFSVESSTMQLGEDPLSYGYGGTGKISTDCKFKDFGTSFGTGDVILGLLNMDSDPVQIGFAKNGKFLGWAYRINKRELKGQALFPHVLTKNVSFEVNFGQKEKPYSAIPDNFKEYTFISCVPVDKRIGGTRAPKKREDCEMIMMCGLPGAGKSVWAEEYSKKNLPKKYNILGTNNIIDKMKVMGLPRKRNYHGRWDVLIQMATKCLNKLFQIGSKLRRNYILDQTNVYPTAQRRKMRNFEGFKRIAVVIVPTDGEYKRRCDKRDREEGKEVPDSAVLEMKANFKIPEENDLFNEIIFTELKRKEAEELVTKYNEEGRAATGPPRKQFKSNDQSPGFDNKRGFDSGRGGSMSSRGTPSGRGFSRGGFDGSRGDQDGGRGGFRGGRGGFGGGRGGFEGNQGGGFDGNRGGFDRNQGGFDGGYDGGRGGFDRNRGGPDSQRGGFDGGRGGYGGRGGFDKSRGGRGGFDSNQRGYDGGRGGGFDSGRFEGGRGGGFDGRGGGRGGFNDSHGGYENRRGGYDSNRGGYDSGHSGYDDGGYDSNRGGYDSRSGYDSGRSGYDGGRGGHDTGRGGYDRGRGGYSGSRGGQDGGRGFGRKRTFDDGPDSSGNSGTYEGYGDNSGFGNSSRGGYSSRGGRGRGDFGAPRTNDRDSYGSFGSDNNSAQYSSGNYSKESGSYDRGGTSGGRGQRGFRGGSSRGDMSRGGSSRGGSMGSRGGNSSRGSYGSGNTGGSSYGGSSQSQDASSNYSSGYGGYQSNYNDNQQSGYRDASDSYSSIDSSSYGSTPSGGFKKEPGTEGGGFDRTARGSTHPSGRPSRWSAETPQTTSYSNRGTTASQSTTSTYSTYTPQVKTEPGTTAGAARYDSYNTGSSSGYSTYIPPPTTNQGFQGTQTYGYQAVTTTNTASQPWATTQPSTAATTQVGQDQQQWAQYYQQQSQPGQYYGQYYGQAPAATATYGSVYPAK